MVDITDYTVGSNDTHTHVAKIDGDILHLNIEDNGNLMQALASANEDEYEIHELIREVCIPYIIFNGTPDTGAQCLQAIMKRLYNVCSPIAVLSNPSIDSEGKSSEKGKAPMFSGDNADSSKASTSELKQPQNAGNKSSEFQYIICAPYSRVNRDMLKEIMDTFRALCKYRNIDYEPKFLHYMPLTWNVSSYKEGVEIDNALAFDVDPYIVLSTRLSEEPLASKVKMNSTQSKKAALIDSILMYSREEIKGDKAKAKELVSLISKNRSRDMFYFLAMGRCLYRIFSGDDDGLELWKEASIKEVHPLCDDYWPVLETTCTYYRIHTLQYWAKKDSPKEYAEWNSTSIRAALEASVLATGGILDIGNVAYRKDPTLFICDGDEPKEAIFFKFNGTYYKPCGIFVLQDYLDKEIIPEYEEFLKDLTKVADSNPQQGPESSFTDMMKKKIDKCISIIVKLKSDSFQVSVVRCLMRLYNKPGFDNIRDSNPNLTAFEDCVFDADRKCIRDGIPEDNLTCSTGYEFKEIWNSINTYTDINSGKMGGWEHPDVKVVLENLEKIIHDVDTREVLRREFASGLHVSNPLKRGVICQGPTNNGKSALYSWKAKAYGSTYNPDVPNNLFYSEDSHPGNATPQFEMARFARFIDQAEVDDSKILNEALYKRWTSGIDKMTYRALYGRKIKSFTPRSKPHTICNTSPKINGNSAALRTRTIMICLDSKFITEKDIEFEQIRYMSQEERDAFMKENHWYWADTQFDEIIEKTHKAFMWLMIQDFIKYSGGPSTIGGHKNVPAVKLPKSIVEKTVEYFTKSNIFLQFITQATKRATEAPGITTFTLYNAYKKWYSDTINRFGYVGMPKFIEELAALGIKHNTEVYQGRILTYQ